jgi:succinate-acetate transporter protein
MLSYCFSLAIFPVVLYYSKMTIKTPSVIVLSLNVLFVLMSIRNFIVESYLCLIKLSVKDILFSVEQQYALVSAKLSLPNGAQVLVIFNPRTTIKQ